MVLKYLIWLDKLADAVVVGIQLVEEIAAGRSGQLQRVDFTKDLKQAILEYR